MMLFLLPPSEGKTPASGGPTFAANKLVFPELGARRMELMEALADFCKEKPELAAEALGLGPSQANLLTLDQELLSAHCAPAIQIYTGVLYDHLGYSTLAAKARSRADSSILIASALFGFVAPTDLIPAYRFSGSSTIPIIGSLAHYWRPELLEVLDREKESLVLDMRSGSYEKLAPAKQLDRAVVNVKVLTEVNGKLKPVTHFNKATKGDLVRAACRSALRFPTKIEQVGSYFTKLGFQADLNTDGTGIPTLHIVTE